MSRRRFWLSLVMAIAALLSLLLCYTVYRVQQMLDEQHVELSWQEVSLTWRGLHLHEMRLLQYRDGELKVSAGQVQLQWLAHEAPRYRLLVQDLRMDWQPGYNVADTPPVSDLSGFLQTPLSALPWLPRHIEVRDMQAQLPCTNGRCTLAGELDLQRLDDALRLRVRLLREDHTATLQADLQGLDNRLDGERQVQMTLHLDDQQQMSLHTALTAQDDALQWNGKLLLAPLQEIAWVAAWLQEWTRLETTNLPTTPQQAGIIAQWQLQLLPGTRQLGELLAAPGWLRVDAQLPQPWPLPSIGLLSGALQLDLLNTSGRWQARTLNGNLHLDTQDAPWLAALPNGLRANHLQLHLQPLQSRSDNELGLQLRLTTDGALHVQANAELGLTQSRDWALQVRQLQFDARSQRVDLAGSRADDLYLHLDLSGNATPHALQLELAANSRLEIQRLRSADLDLQQTRLSLAGLDLTGMPNAPILSGPLALRVHSLQHPQLQAQGWQWQGQVEAGSGHQTLDGTLLADSGLNLALNLNNTAGTLSLNARLDELFLRAGNPLAHTLVNWPQLLTLDNGRIQGNVNMSLPTAKPLHLQGRLNGKGLAGIYDRSTLSGVEGELQLQLIGDRLTLALPNLSAKQIDPGIELGPLQLQARYEASRQNPPAGSLSLQRAELSILGGSLRLEPATWALDQSSHLLPLKLSGLDLQALFRAYPAEGLEGNGLLDGTLPLRLGEAISIEQGQIEARAPGGRLRFHSPRIRAMGQANPGMKLVTDALEDFHYDVLNSSLDYDQSGTLRLGMRLHGQNPAIEQGRPIHFTINLEEDIPTLLASLQLTDKVSDIIQQRIQQRMRQRVPEETKE